MTKISNGLLDQVTDGNTRPSVNYANIWLDHLFPFPWFMYILVWSGKVVFPMALITSTQSTAMSLCLRQFWHGDDKSG